MVQLTEALKAQLNQNFTALLNRERNVKALFLHWKERDLMLFSINKSQYKMKITILHEFLSLQIKLNMNKLPDANRLFLVHYSTQNKEPTHQSAQSVINHRKAPKSYLLHTCTMIYHKKRWQGLWVNVIFITENQSRSHWL